MRLLALLLLVVVGCVTAPTSIPCTPGAQVACACGAGLEGTQVCTVGGSYSACSCPDAGSPADAPNVDVGAPADASVPIDMPRVNVVDAPPPVDIPADVACPTGFADCDHNPTNGCEANLGSDRMNCGACGVACAGGRACTASGDAGAACVACPVDHPTLCGNTCTNLNTDNANCGICGSPCPTGHRCILGACP